MFVSMLLCEGWGFGVVVETMQPMRTSTAVTIATTAANIATTAANSTTLPTDLDSEAFRTERGTLHLVYARIRPGCSWVTQCTCAM